jgi:aspartyl-tRNA(Asn)/glutamyl-tRNA(Gln) amidotransferase subunit C
MDTNNKIELVKSIAALANLEFTDIETEKLSTQFEKIVDYIAKIEVLDLEKIEPISQITNKNNAFREDVVVPSLTTKEALKNSPSKNDYYFKVPKVLE